MTLIGKMSLLPSAPGVLLYEVTTSQRNPETLLGFQKHPRKLRGEKDT